MRKTSNIDPTSEIAQKVQTVKAKKPSIIPPKVTSEPINNTFIVENVTPNWQYISDLKLTIEPFGHLDLTYEDESTILSSLNLKTAIKKGLLRRLSEQELEIKLEDEIARERAEILQNQRQKARLQNEVALNDHSAEAINLNRTDSGIDAKITTAGDPNDPVTYATAFSAASAEYAARGRRLDPRDFANMVENNPDVIKKYISNDMHDNNRGITSGDSRRGKATVMMPTGDGGSTSARIGMTNWARDGVMGGLDSETIEDISGGGYTESIDLSSE